MDVETPEILTTDALLSISPSPVISPAVGEQLTLNLKITAGEAVAGYQFIVRFDPTALRYVESGNGEYLRRVRFLCNPLSIGIAWNLPQLHLLALVMVMARSQQSLLRLWQ